MRSTPGRPHPLIITLSYRRWQSVVCRNSVFPGGFHNFMAKSVLFPCPQRFVAVPPYPGLGDPGGTQNPAKNGMKKQVLRKRSQKRSWGARGEPQETPGSPNEAKMGTKRLPKRSPKRHCLRLGWKMENVTKTYYLLHFSHIGRPRKSRFWLIFGIPNRH